LIKFNKEITLKTYSQLKKGSSKNSQNYRKINLLLNNAKNIYIFGANTCSLELLSARNSYYKKIRFIIDDDPLKWGKVLVNHKIKIKPRQECKNISGPKTFIICSYYSHEDLFNFLSKNLEPPFEIIRLHPEIKLIRSPKDKQVNSSYAQK